MNQAATNYTAVMLVVQNSWKTSKKERRCGGLDTTNDLGFTLLQSDGHTKPQPQTPAILPSVFVNSFCQKRAPIYCNLMMISKIFIFVLTSFSGSVEWIVMNFLEYIPSTFLALRTLSTFPRASEL